MTENASANSDQPARQQSAPKILSHDALWFLLLCVLIVTNVLQPYGEASMDFFNHIAIGRWIWDHHSVPHDTIFLWSAHQSWIAHSWLSELFLLSMMANGDQPGEALALAWTCATSIGIYAILFFAFRPSDRHPLVFIGALGLGAYISSLRMVPRPELFSDLGTVLVLLWLTRRQDSRSPSPLAGRAGEGFRPPSLEGLLPIILLFVLWANLHGGVASGLVLIGLTVVGDVVQDIFAKSKPRTGGPVPSLSSPVVQLVTALVACTVALACTPFGIRYFSLFTHLHTLTFKNITEWRPLFSPPAVEPSFIVAPALLLIVTLTAWVRTPDRQRLSHLLWLAFGAATFVEARRNIVGFDWTCLAVMAQCRAGLDWRPNLKPRRLRDLRLGSNCAIVAGFVFAIAHSNLAENSWRLDLENPLSLPVRQLAFLENSGYRGPIYNSYLDSSYYEWKLYGRNTFFIDAINAYPDSLMSTYAHVQEADAVGMRYLDEHHVNCVQAEPIDPGVPRQLLELYNILTASPQWALVYDGDDGYVWVRRVPELQAIWSHTVQ